MKIMHYQNTISIAIFFLSILTSAPVLSNNEIDEHNYLNEARLKLGEAFDSYKKGEIDTTKRNLEVATEFLNKAAQNSKAEKSGKEIRKLAAEIDAFKEKLTQSSKPHENSIARFWHRTTSIIKREADHLIHSYVEQSIAGKTLKHLLDAKMHLFTAEHDLFVSHDAEDAEDELSQVLNDLNEANEVANPAIKNRVIALSENIKFLKENLTKKGIWENDSVVKALDNALVELNNVNENTTPTIKLRIELLKIDINTLRTDVQKTNIRNDYDSAMATLQNIINGL